MPRDLTKAEIGMLQESMVQIISMTGHRPTELLVHPLIQDELGVSLSLFAMEHRITIKREPLLRPPMMVFRNPTPPEGEEWRG